MVWSHHAVFLCSMGFTQSHLQHITAVVQLHGRAASCEALEINAAVDGENKSK